MSSDTASINDLFQSAADDDVLSDDALETLQVTDLGTKIGDALGTPADEFEQGEVVLVAMLIDDSGSIRFCGNSDVAREAHNIVIEALRESKQQDNILFHSRLLSGTVINPFVNVDQAVMLDTHNYNPVHGTPLYDEAVPFWASILAKTQEFADQGVPARSISRILTDGSDQHSSKFYEMRPHLNDPSKPHWRAPTKGVAALARDLLRQECHILTGMGIADDDDPDYCTNFAMIFEAMGIDASKDDKGNYLFIEDVKQGGRTKEEFKSEIRRNCQVFSQSAVRASQSAGSFSQMATGGFGN